ncbi:IS66 family transposase [Desulfosporosinus metallidurans]|uniref:Mobile element protein n=1 Tax=Desulfosporosinus metallidurans TaxID=1888891 RepID=A0A1Q8QQ73_9FIRM|nr:transposase [Desulfosporosinus metallidurans]OLN29501.1 Mobile element protein [Desulfosporosinus metallidurans]
MDSTQIMSNIKLGGRLSLAYDVLVCGAKALPETLLNDSLRIFLKADYKTTLLYQLKATDIQSRIQTILNHCAELLQLVEGQPELKETPAVQTIDRFLKEQASFNEQQNQWIAKGDREISSNSLQSVHDTDATYRNKGGKKHVGYALNLTETCANDNPVQVVTHFDVAPNTTSDVEMLNQSLATIAGQGVKDLYTDGGYYSPNVVEEAETHGIMMHFTDMTGRKTSSGKLPYSSFTIEDKKTIVLCPELFALERQWKHLPHEERKQKRLEQSIPVLNAFFAWAENVSTNQEPLKKAIKYTLNHREYFTNFLLDGRIPISNNRRMPSELSL